VFGFTKSEKKVTKALVFNKGESSRVAAASADISYETFRWHLKNIFSKTGFKGQEDLLIAISEMDISNADV
jgi:DNA-binding CsgD family transcriptional regulator